MPESAIGSAKAAWHSLTGEYVKGPACALRAAASETKVVRFQSGGRAVVAKRCLAATAELERRIYQQGLSQLACPTLEFHGIVAAEGGLAWLFVEDAGGVPYEPHRPAHRRAAASWLAALHSTVGESMAPGLPGKQPQQYRELLERVTAMLDQLRAGDPADRSARALVDAVAAHCRRLSDEWGAIARACPAEISSLVHGDLVTHNARIRPDGDSLVFLPFDWEKAGWGTTAEDVSDIDLDCYVETAAELGRQLDLAVIGRMAAAGKSFRCLVFLDWLAPALGTRSAAAFAHLEQCRTWLDGILSDRRWVQA